MAPTFTPIEAIAGGALIGLAATILYLSIGKVAGISGILSGFLAGEKPERPWRGAFLSGLLLGGIVLFGLQPSAFGASSRPVGMLVVAGFAVGVGTQIGSGCTSGHGVCGLSRFSKRSLVAVCTFMGTAIATVLVLRTFTGAP